ncbi:MAG TPA: hypothetical protein VFF50_14760, partial [Candidatus Deferrimicrobiaceae bacterium]|nr:hypothetical protein [Candidatus Deferrimicrobiaceae bacterium]
ISPNDLRYKITHTLPLTLLQSLANVYMASIMLIALALGCAGTVCESDSASGQFAVQRQTCLSRELLWGGGQLDKFSVPLSLVNLHEVLNLHRQDGNSFPNRRRARWLAKSAITRFVDGR